MIDYPAIHAQFRSNLARVPEAVRDYAKSRGLTRSAVEAFEIGYCEQGWLAGRLIFPFMNAHREVVGFGGRAIPGVTLPREGETLVIKYLNSRIKKSNFFFGLPQAIPHILDSGQAIVVEGYMDVVSMWIAGYKNTLAVCGTELTPIHVNLLTIIAPRVVILFDGDEPGIAAGKKAEAMFNGLTKVRRIELPHGEDPDSMCRAKRMGEVL